MNTDRDNWKGDDICNLTEEALKIGWAGRKC